MAGASRGRGDWLVERDGHLWRVVRVSAASVTLARRGTEIECPLENGRAANTPDMR